MPESNGDQKRRSTYGVDPKTVAAVAGFGAVYGAIKAALLGKTAVDILGAAAIAGWAGVIVGAVATVHRKEASHDGPVAEAAQSG
ncbi:hypothetical protein [Azospirillum soli]|uniref:hypothetical protein n=1 Tax=Azospirillum soli TaxID=1304799 RepID=UPI001AE48E13|nr:hypothetical protein [Azospirillum soli]MBP2312947.1 hypothetical protein [Azospirillum soli]